MVITFNNSKGGVAKTTSCSIVAQLLAAGGYKVLVCDLDPQGNVSSMFGSTSDEARKQRMDATLQEILQNKSVLMDDMQKDELNHVIYGENVTKFPNLEVLPGNRELSEIVYTLRNKCVEVPETIMIFKNNLKKITEYDYILIDTSPFKSYLTTAAIVASDYVYTPIEADNFSFEGLKDILNNIEEINKKFDLNVLFGGVFITKADVRTTRFKQIKKGYEEMLGDKFIPAVIRKYESIGQSSTMFEPLLKWDKKCPAIDDYLELCKLEDWIDGKHYRTLRKYLKG